jgi:hypothetical protein
MLRNTLTLIVNRIEKFHGIEMFEFTQTQNQKQKFVHEKILNKKCFKEKKRNHSNAEMLKMESECVQLNVSQQKHNTI